MIDNGLIPDRGGVWIDAYNQCVNEDIAGTVTTRIDMSNHYWTTELKMEEPKPMQVAQIYDQEQNPMNGRVYSAEGISPTLRTPTGGLSEPCILDYTRDDKGNVTNRHEKEIAGTLHTSTGNGGNTDQFVKTRYRIRKLTERECFRLMDVDDSDIDKIEANRIKVTLKNGTVKEKPIPKSRKYMLAGNSIAVNVLYHIFKAMFIDEQPQMPRQLSLFD